VFGFGLAFPVSLPLAPCSPCYHRGSVCCSSRSAGVLGLFVSICASMAFAVAYVSSAGSSSCVSHIFLSVGVHLVSLCVAVLYRCLGLTLGSGASSFCSCVCPRVSHPVARFLGARRDGAASWCCSSSRRRRRREEDKREVLLGSSPRVCFIRPHVSLFCSLPALAHRSLFVCWFVTNTGVGLPPTKMLFAAFSTTKGLFTRVFFVGV